LGVLQAINDVGVPIDVVGGTSQGAFMAALYAQGLSSDQLKERVRSFASQMMSPRHLLSDVTLPILSLFSGHHFDRVRMSLLRFVDIACPNRASLFWMSVIIC
jgi:lysophospholipid hydrolase